MNLLISPSSNPYYNLAAEEFLLKNSLEDFIFLYVNRPSVVVGKHQITVKEMNSKLNFENNILIARRLSGGGTVYHDEGNLNFSVIQTIPQGTNLSYKLISKPIIDFLLQEGAAVYLSDRNDIMMSDMKISGSAMHIYKNRVLAHCTLLVDCNLNKLSSSLRSNSERFTDKSISSVKSKVANLSSANNNFSVSYLIDHFTKFIDFNNGISKITSFDEFQIDQINELTSEKYSSPVWIYGYSPKYNYNNVLEYNGNTINYHLLIEKGIIKSILFESTHALTPSNKMDLNKLIGTAHNISAFLLTKNTTSKKDFRSLLINSLF